MFEPIDNFRNGIRKRALAVGIQPLQPMRSWNGGFQRNATWELCGCGNLRAKAFGFLTYQSSMFARESSEFS